MILAYPPERLAEVLQRLQEHGLCPSRLQFIHGSIQAQAKIFLVEAIKDAKEDIVVLPALCVYNETSSAERIYSPEMQKIGKKHNVGKLIVRQQKFRTLAPVFQYVQIESGLGRKRIVAEFDYQKSKSQHDTHVRSQGKKPVESIKCHRYLGLRAA